MLAHHPRRSAATQAGTHHGRPAARPDALRPGCLPPAMAGAPPAAAWTATIPTGGPGQPWGSDRSHSRSLLGIASLSDGDLWAILEGAKVCKARLLQLRAGAHPAAVYGGDPPWQGRRLLTLFFENSTRTMQSFHAAARYLGAEPVDFPVSRSSVEKGEGLRDTLRTCQLLGMDAVVLRHPSTGAAAYAASVLDVPVINAGDGTGEHPTQALLDAFTIGEHKGGWSGLKVAIVGDVRHSRVARSNTLLLGRLGAQVWLCGPPGLLPPEGALGSARVTTHLEEALRDADVVMALRIQRERMDRGSIPDLAEYRRGWAIDLQRLQWARPDALIMHPGPVNRGVELAPEVLELPRCVVEQQVVNGVAVRMAVLEWLLGGGGGGNDHER